MADGWYPRNLICAVVAAAWLALAGAVAAEPLKVGFVYLTTVGDAGWTYQHELGRRLLEKTFGDKVEASFVEGVSEGADAERVIREMAASGYKVIFTTSFGYMNPTIRVAKRFPDVVFEHCSGYKRADNVGTYLARFYEGRYLTGVVAGKMTRSGRIGYVAAFPIPEVVRGINAFTRGLRSVNPSAEVRVVWVNAWDDPGKDREAAEALIAQGADVIAQHVDSTAPVQTAEERGVYAIGYHSDMSKYGPTAHLTASTHLWGGHYVDVVKAVMAGTWSSGAVWGGIADGMVELAPFGAAVPADVRALVAAKTAAIRSGELHPFAGPVSDQDGKVRVAAGEVMSDGDMLGFDWYVEGVVGKLPK